MKLLMYNRFRGRKRAGAKASAVSTVGFTLLEVMIACGIFFMATFAILALVAGTLRNARVLQRTDLDAGMAAALVSQMLKTNREAQATFSGDFGDSYPDYSWSAEANPYDTNGLLEVNIILNKRGNRLPSTIIPPRITRSNRAMFPPLLPSVSAALRTVNARAIAAQNIARH